MLDELNNSISQATNIALGEDSDLVTLSSSIDTVSDIDLYRLELEAGQGITFDIDTPSAPNNTANFDSLLRIFDADGNELAVNDDYSLPSEEFSLDSYLGFIANATEEYYVGVSSFANQNYNPLNGVKGERVENNFVAGEYDLTLEMVEVVADDDPDNTLVEAIDSTVDSVTSSRAIAGEIETELDVDLYRLELAEGQGIEIEALADNSELDSYLRLFDANGNELAFNDNGTDSNITLGNSAIALAPQPGTYFVGVSSAGNYDYDAINGDTNLNFSPNTGISMGSYNLQLEIVEIVEDSDPDNTIAEAVDSGVNSTGLACTVLSGEIQVQSDVDLYQFELAEGEQVNLDINAEDLNSDLNSLLRVFDSQGNELAFDDNNDNNYTAEYSPDSKLTFVPETPGAYYVGVGTSDNLDYDAIAGSNNFSREIANPYPTIGSYELAIGVSPQVADADPDNTIPEAIDTQIGTSNLQSASFSNAIDLPTDVDFYRFELDRGKTIALDLDTMESEQKLDSVIQVFDAEGNKLAINDDYSAPDENSSLDSYLEFTATTTAEYYVGISSLGNLDYNPLVDSNSSNNLGSTTGDYELAIAIM